MKLFPLILFLLISCHKENSQSSTISGGESKATRFILSHDQEILKLDEKAPQEVIPKLITLLKGRYSFKYLARSFDKIYEFHCENICKIRRK